ncbi:uncharacterized protein LOC133187509 isoform X1 [Saccostrea echinata]|uniref:uncharacterized protein LOC133187509 isoform X1 n=1 Tax=Saccostrea echinata TaxID=191078 RepID=UPI002A7F15D8|nr:uncharacterized protein LOC133187509 isoform X1 [Saccostrea echinata]XP_061178896.1 uncharacterized protein LOC133187509 isoform X1 [Saccostrea echinata]
MMWWKKSPKLHVTDRVTASITTLINEVVNTRSSNLNNQGSIDNSNVQASPQIAISDSSVTVNAQSSVLPEATESNKGRGQTGFVSTAVPIEALVSDQIKAKIWSNQCIDFVKLLSKEKQKKGKFSLQVENSDTQGKLTIHQVENDAENKSNVSSMHDWITAWNRYAAIYCIKYPEQQSKLAKHLEAVRDIADAKGNWKNYDAEFRQLVSQGQVAWGDVHMELYVNARLKTDLLTKVSSENKDATSGPIPKGACFNFHAGKQCRAGLSSRFQHMCYNCGSNHPFNHCNKQTQQPFRFLRKFYTQTNKNNKEFTNPSKQRNDTSKSK